MFDCQSNIYNSIFVTISMLVVGVHCMAPLNRFMAPYKLSLYYYYCYYYYEVAIKVKIYKAMRIPTVSTEF